MYFSKRPDSEYGGGEGKGGDIGGGDSERGESLGCDVRSR